MARFNPFRKENPKERQTSFKELSLLQKIRYIVGYYWIWFLVVVISGLVIAFTWYDHKLNDFETVIMVDAVDVRMKGCDYDEDYITTNFTKYLNLDGKNRRAIIDFGYTLKNAGSDQEAQLSADKIVTMASTSNLDACLMPDKQILIFSNDETTFFEDLRKLLTAEELEKIGDENLVYFTKTTGEKIPVAVNLKDTKIKTETNCEADAPCYGIVVSAPRKDAAVDFIRFAFEL